LSDDGAHGLTLIAFVGSVFSPYYAWARRRGAAPAAEHCAVNVALYGPRGRWAMTERGAARIARSDASLTIGPSSLHWDGAALEIALDERCAPLPKRIRGRIRLLPSSLGDRSFFLDDAGMHRWTPFAPRARIEVNLEQPGLDWRGDAYLDSNDGDGPLEETFRSWTWSRANLRDGTLVLYDTVPRTSAPRSWALQFDAAGAARRLALPPPVELDTTGWRVGRRTRADAGAAARVIATFEDGPFYARSLLETRLYGETAQAIHESLSLDRFRAPWVQCLLPFRMPRAF
jgi:carotenoid 1,2-hydratase